MTSLFAAVSLGLAAIGLYALMSYQVAQRTREIGIRIALGAAGGNVRGLVLRQALVLGAWGVGLGWLASAAVLRFPSSQLYGVGTADPVSFLGSGLILLATILLAVLLPARRAARVDPIRALRAS